MSEKPTKDPGNPLETVTLSEVFSKDVDTFTDEDIDIIVATLRKNRKLFSQAEAEGRRAGTKGKQFTGLSLDDLDINLDDI